MNLLSATIHQSNTLEATDLTPQNWQATEDSLKQYGFAIVKSLLNKSQ
jgi:hypothetical protein